MGNVSGENGREKEEMNEIWRSTRRVRNEIERNNIWGKVYCTTIIFPRLYYTIIFPRLGSSISISLAINFRTWIRVSRVTFLCNSSSLLIHLLLSIISISKGIISFPPKPIHSSPATWLVKVGYVIVAIVVKVSSKHFST